MTTKPKGPGELVREAHDTCLAQHQAAISSPQEKVEDREHHAAINRAIRAAWMDGARVAIGGAEYFPEVEPDWLPKEGKP